MASIKFKGMKRLARMSKEKREEQVRGLARKVYKAAGMAAQLVILDKAEIVEMVRENFDGGGLLWALADAAEDAKALLDIIHSAECRLACCLAVLEEG